MQTLPRIAIETDYVDGTRIVVARARSRGRLVLVHREADGTIVWSVDGRMRIGVPQSPTVRAMISTLNAAVMS